MTNFTNLKAELDSDPLARGYAGMTDAEVAASLNTPDRSRGRATMSGSEILNEVDPTEWAAKTDAQKQLVWDICHLGNVNPFGIEANLMVDVFGGGSATITALAAARVETITRAQELGLGVVREGTVQQARAL